MKKYTFLLILLFTMGHSIDAKLASSKPPLPTFEDVHEAFTRIVVNEAGWKSRPDINGILEVLLKHGGGRNRSRGYKGSGYGIDYRRFITYAAKASLKTFPPECPWAQPIMKRRYGASDEAARRRHVQRQKKSIGNSLWSSTMKRDCSEPENWSLAYPETQWAGFEDRCKEIFRLTEEYLKGEHPNWCRTLDGEQTKPYWWGGIMDDPDHRWEEVICDEPGAECEGFDWRKDPNNTSCARNSFYRP
jgi:hypothetical protein